MQRSTPVRLKCHHHDAFSSARRLDLQRGNEKEAVAVHKGSSVAEASAAPRSTHKANTVAGRNEFVCGVIPGKNATPCKNATLARSTERTHLSCDPWSRHRHALC